MWSEQKFTRSTFSPITRRRQQQQAHNIARQQHDDTFGLSSSSSSSNHHDVGTTTKEQPEKHEMMEVDWDKIEKIDSPHQSIVKSTNNSNDVTKPSVDNSNLTMTSPNVVMPVEKPDSSSTIMN
ncbi:hypothetical protein MBANPS3_003444 [Mucor bainieri]